MRPGGDESRPAPDALRARYEELRGRVLAEGSWGGRLGIALLLREGVAAWMEAWRLCPEIDVPTALAAAEDGELWSAQKSAEVVRVLANMALGGLAGSI